MGERKNRKKPHNRTDLREYRHKRDFNRTREPREGGRDNPSPSWIFVVQKHAARRLHYDFRLEAEGVLKSWAVPRGPSYDPAEKRLAVHVEDHPIEYADFEGLIAENQYGAGAVMIWDRGTWTPVGDWKKGMAAGKLKFRLEGRKLRGTWTLVRIKDSGGEGAEAKDHWLLIKSPDEPARRLRSYDVTAEEPLSVKTSRDMEQIEAEKTAYGESPGEGRSERRVEKAPGPPEPKGTRAPWPDSFYPQLATLVTRLPEGDRWITEIKFDGYRLLAQINEGRVVLSTRRGQNWTEKFVSIARELTRLPVRTAILDGEIVVLDPDGTTNFQKLQNIMKSGNQSSLIYYVFDVPYYQDHDLSGVPLVERKALLRDLVSTYQERIPSVRYSDDLPGSGERILRAACGYGVEGIVAKRADSHYAQKRTKQWVKKKCVNRQEFVVGGYTKPKGSRSFFGSLLLGYYNEARRLVYCGNVGTGFNEQSIRRVYEELKKLEQDQSPFPAPIEDARNRDVRWVAPRLVAEVEFSDWTEAGYLRHPSFAGMREDRKPEEVMLEKATAPPDETTPSGKAAEEQPRALPVKLSNPERVLYPDQGLTKQDLAEYYMKVAKWMLPELANRPLVLVRCPEGIPVGMRENCFFQKHLRDQVPEGVRSAEVEEKGEVGLYPVVDDQKGLLSLVQLGVLEIHMLGCRADDVDHPDRMIFDLDPAPEVSKTRLIEATFYIRDRLLENGMEPFLKLTGGKGIHIVVRMKPVLTWEEVKKVSNAIAVDLVRRKPDWFVATVSQRRRTGKILVDYLRNSLGASSIVPYSTRARPSATIAHPVSGSELTEALLSNPLTVKDAAERLGKMSS